MSNVRILIVEDELIVAADISNRLRRLGYEVVGQTDNGEDAVDLAGRLSPSLVLMDIQLRGEIDGVEAAERIIHRHQLPVIFLTAHADDATLQRAKTTEPFGYVIKPFDERDLKTGIEVALYKHAADRRVRESERRYATTLSSIGDAVISTDRQGRITFMNPVAEVLTGWSASDAVGRPLSLTFNIIDEQSREEVESPVEKVLRDGKFAELANSTLLITRDGREIPIDDCAAPIRDDDDACTGAVLVFRDVTAKKQLEDELRQAQKMEAIGRLAGGVAHDFNNMLTVINGYASLMLESLDPDHNFFNVVTEIARTGDRAAELTQQLLAFGRKQMLQPKVIDLNVNLTNTERFLRRLIGDNVELKACHHPDTLYTKVDPGQLEQVIVNLAINARDAMPEGGRLTLATSVRHVNQTDGRLKLPCGSYAELRVSDTGCGMSPETKAKIFEPFFTTKLGGKGTGLGLASVYGIVKQSGGDVDVESEPGRGSTFIVYLPLHNEQPVAILPSAPSGFPRGDETVMVVEDDDAVLGLATQLLEVCGYKVLPARNGIDALEKLEYHDDELHLLVTDLVMPRMGGRDLADTVRSKRTGIRVLYLTGYSDDAIIREDLANATAALLTKPFTLKQLATKVREVFDETA